MSAPGLKAAFVRDPCHVAEGPRTDLTPFLYCAQGAVWLRRGAPKPDISSVEAFKRALLDTKLVAYAAQNASGAYFQNSAGRDPIRSRDNHLPSCYTSNIRPLSDRHEKPRNVVPPES